LAVTIKVGVSGCRCLNRRTSSVPLRRVVDDGDLKLSLRAWRVRD
jgi:hypothetical protein